MKTSLEFLAEELGVHPDQLRSDALDMLYLKLGFAPGDKVYMSSPEFVYEVASIKKFPHGWMIGIYDEPPGKHVDFWNPSSLTKVTK